MDLSSRQLEAQLEGQQTQTLRFLNQHHLLAIVIFILIIVSAELWAWTIVTVAAKIFGVSISEMKIWMWVLFAFIFTLCTYIIVRYIVKIPLTSAFGL
jgi:hypothetical protein